MPGPQQGYPKGKGSVNDRSLPGMLMPTPVSSWMVFMFQKRGILWRVSRPRRDASIRQMAMDGGI